MAALARGEREVVDERRRRGGARGRSAHGDVVALRLGDIE